MNRAPKIHSNQVYLTRCCLFHSIRNLLKCCFDKQLQKYVKKTNTWWALLPPFLLENCAGDVMLFRKPETDKLLIDTHVQVRKYFWNGDTNSILVLHLHESITFRVSTSCSCIDIYYMNVIYPTKIPNKHEGLHWCIVAVNERIDVMCTNAKHSCTSIIYLCYHKFHSKISDRLQSTASVVVIHPH